MLVAFDRVGGINVAINPKFVILVVPVKDKSITRIVMIDGGTTEVVEDYNSVIARLNSVI